MNSFHLRKGDGKERLFMNNRRITEAGRVIVSMLIAFTATASSADFKINRSAMSEEYWNIWNDEEQAKIDADIEANRKADASVAVEAPDGTEIRYEQLTHDFRFGASTFNFEQLGSSKLNRRHEAAWGEGGIFNQGTVPFYWREYEPKRGVIRADDGEATTEAFWNALPRKAAIKNRFWRRPPPQKVIDFLRSREAYVHGHILVTGGLRPMWLYEGCCPEEEKRFLEGFGLPSRKKLKAKGKEHAYWNFWRGSDFWHFCTQKVYPKLSEREIAAALPVWIGTMGRLWTKRVLDIGARFGDKADSWDVVNESSRDFARYGTSRTGLPVWKSYKGIMPGDFPLVALLDAKRAFPASAKLCINDNSINENFLEQVKDLVDEGARIDVVGCQMHITKIKDMKSLIAGKDNVEWVGTPKTIRDRLDMMARTGRRIHVSEITIPQVDKSKKAIDAQAIVARNLYRIWFSHKDVSGITWWCVVDGCTWPGIPPHSGVFTRELNKKPVYEALDSLINGEWRTKGAVAAKNGKASFRGFRGRYRLTWKDSGGQERSKTVSVK